MWEKVSFSLRQSLGEETYRNWIQPLKLQTFDETSAVLEAPTAFIKDWVATHFQEAILKTFKTHLPQLASLEFAVALQADGVSVASDKDAVVGAALPTQAARLGSQLDQRLTFENFVVGKPNEFAYAAAVRVADSKEVTFNPLFLHGGVGLGKTHLMHAIARRIQETNPHRSVMYLSAEKFMYHFIKALRSKDTVSFKDRFRSVDVLMIDDIQFISGKESTQEEFFHTFNALIDQKHQVVLSADKSPSDLEGIEERVRSRLAWGLVADIHPTTYELRLGILEAKAEEMGNVPSEVLEFLAQQVTSNVRELEGALTRVTAHANLVGRKMSIEMAKEVLKDLLRACNKTVTVDDIQRFVSNYYSIRLADLHSPKRSKAVALPRQIAMFLAKELTTKSLPEIGRSFGGRDHTTVLYGVRKITEELSKNTKIQEDIDLLRRMLQS